jgi:LmbE family N-acetylglucosaminyl deacetylase
VGALELARRVYRSANQARERREAESFRTRMRFDPGAPELLLSPHWDDAVLDCWSVLAAEPEVTVANLFAGTPASGRLTEWDAITGAGDSAQRAAERRAEDARALQVAGREPLNLALLDAQYRPAGTAPGLQDIDSVLGDLVTSASRVYAPAGIGSHADHVLARTYARMLCRAGFPVTLYAELPYCVRHGWPAWVDGGEPDPFRDVEAFWRPFLAQIPELGPVRGGRVERLDDRAAAGKLEAMRCYRTQLPALDYAAAGALLERRVYGFELFWELHRG